MNIITKAINDLHHTIPQQILQLTFNTDAYGVSDNIENNIMNSVVLNRVLPDTNIVGGTTMTIPLERCRLISDTGTGKSVWYVDKNLTNGKSIMSVHSVSSNLNVPIQAVGTNDLLNAVEQVTASNSPVNMVSSSLVELISENTILMDRYWAYNSANSILTVKVANSDTLSEINPRGGLVFSDLVRYAVQAYIYNKNILTVNINSTYAGYDASTLTSKIEEYADSNELYSELLRTKWSIAAFTSDREAHHKLMRSQVPMGLR